MSSSNKSTYPQVYSNKKLVKRIFLEDKTNDEYIINVKSSMAVKDEFLFCHDNSKDIVSI